MSSFVLIQFVLSLLAALLGASAGWWLRGRPGNRPASKLPADRKQTAAEVLQSLQAAAETVRSCVEQHTECIRTIQSELSETTSTEPAILTNAAEAILASNGLVQHQFRDIRSALDEQRQEIHDFLSKSDGLWLTFASLDRQKHIYRQVLSSLEVLATELTRDIGGHGRRLREISGELENDADPTSAELARAVTQILDATDDVQQRIAVREKQIAAQAATVHMQAILTHADLLTALPNRRALEAELQRAANQASTRAPLATVMLIDLDAFSRVNGEYGHQGGDLVLRQVAELIKRLGKRRDMVARFGGDTFAVLLSQTTLHDALPIAERVRRSISETEFSHGSRPLRLTSSVGIAQLSPDEMRAAELRRVSEALRAAREAGGNVCYRHDGEQCHPVSPAFQSKPRQPTTMEISLASLWRDKSEEDSSKDGSAASETRLRADSATTLTGRSLFAANVGRRLAEWKRGGPSVSVAVLRVDQMAELVTRYGDQGHVFLRQVLGRLLEATTREMDERCEFEDGLFALLLPGTDKDSALAVAERLCDQIRQCKIRMDRGLWDLTASIGVAHCSEASRVMDILLSAESAMDRAAEGGGDAVCAGEPLKAPVADAAP